MMPINPLMRGNIGAEARLSASSQDGTTTGKQVALEVSVVMPCLNESQTLRSCIEKDQAALRQHGIAGEIIVADNGSTDGSQQIGEEAGARVIHVIEKGYGAALRGGIEAARGQFVIMGDADDSYDFSHAPRFVEKLREGYDLVMGNRFQGGIQPGPCPPAPLSGQSRVVALRKNLLQSSLWRLPLWIARLQHIRVRAHGPAYHRDGICQ